MALDAQPAGSSQPARLAGGSQLAGGRFVVEEFQRTGRFGDLYRAVDSTDQSPVTVHVFDPGVATAASGEPLVMSLRAAAGIDHQNAVRVLEAGIDGDRVFAVTELVEGHSLRELLDRKRETGAQGFSPKSAQNILAHLCSALSHAHPGVSHGLISLDNVFINRAGRVRVCDFGVAGGLPGGHAVRRADVGSAPEVAKGGAPTPAADIFSLGAILYQIVVGAPPTKGCARPSEAVPGISREVDLVVGRSMMPAPDKRYKDAAELREAMTKAFAAPSAPARGSAERAAWPSGPLAAAGSDPGIRPGGPGGAVAMPTSRPTSKRPSLAQAITAPSAVAAAAEPSGIDVTANLGEGMSAAMQAALADTEDRWLISKGKLDYGPFPLSDVVDQIRGDQILPGNLIIDKHTGERTAVEDHPLLSELVDQARQQRDDRRRAEAELSAAKQETRRGWGLFVFIGATVIALGVGAFFIVQALSSDDGGDAEAVASIDEGSLEAKISFPTAAERKKRRGKRRGGKRGGSAGGERGGWDDTMDLGDASEGGGSERLDNSQINPVIQRHGGKLSRCMRSTGSRSADIWFIVKGSGRVSQVKVNNQTNSPLANCIRGVMKRMQFPSFDGIRTKANFSMSM